MTKSSKSPRRARKSYEDRTGMNARAANILVKAMYGKQAEFTVDDDGNHIRVWQPSESSSYSNAQLRSCLQNRVAVEAAELLGTVPPSAIKYCVTKGWLISRGTLYFVTRKACLELDLPVRFKGLHDGRKIPFLDAPARKA